ncbi:MAG: hypothetical protein HZC28_16400 [Spirochaetes bacterium]|nr:hypothetical protein [Spirochaetota bacterium]
MNILVNNTPVSVKIEQEKTVGEVVTGIERWCSEQRIAVTEVQVDDTICYITDAASMDASLDGVDKINISAMPYEEYAYQSLTSVHDHIQKLINAKTIGAADLPVIVDGLAWILEVIPRITYLLSINLNEENTLEKLKLLEIKKERLAKHIRDNDGSAAAFVTGEIIPFLNEFVHHTLVLIANAEIQILKIMGSTITRENVIDRLASLAELTRPLITLLEKIVVLLQKGRDHAALMGIDKFADGVGSIINVLARIKETFSVDYDAVVCGDTTLSAVIRDMQKVLESILDAFKNEDFVSVSDLLDYELKPKLALIPRCLGALTETVNRSLS